MRAALVSVLALVVAPAGAGAAGVLSPFGDVAFPRRAYLLVPQPGVDASHAGLVENGARVEGLRATPVPADGRVGVMLVLDATARSGRASVAAAYAAARRFVATRAPQVPVGIVSYSDAVRVLVAPTTARAQLRAALLRPPSPAGDASAWDAAAAAAARSGASGLKAAAVVVVGQVRDAGGVARTLRLTAALKANRGRVYTLGTGGSRQQLHALARAGGGEMLGAAATGPGVAARLAVFARRVDHAAVLQWRSRVPAGARVDLRAVTHAGAVSTAYRGRSAGSAAAPVTAAGDDGPAPLPLVLAALVLLLAAGTLLRGGGDDPRARIEAWLGVAERPADANPIAALGDELITAPERSLARLPVWSSLTEQLELAEIEMAPARWTLGVALAAAVGAWLASSMAGTFAGVVAFVLIALLARMIVRMRVKRVRAAFAEQLADSLQVAASAMRVGTSFVGALSLIVEDAPEPTRREFSRIVSDEQLGVPIEGAFATVVRRMDNRDLEQVAMVSVLQRETGGSGAEALDRVVDTVRGRHELRRLVDTLTAQGRLSCYVMTALPIGLLVLLTIMNPDYMDALYTTKAGHWMLGGAAVLLATGFFSIRRIVEIKV